MRRGRLPEHQAARRDRVEEVLFPLSASLERVDLIALRIRQALARSRYVEAVLEPALDELDCLRDEIAEACDAAATVWRQGQQRRWE